eukprot:GHVS01030637.1.p1 GENE.GHVS01030637.1~~GHVS01030637.1.p1  ORF type:complete len:340 (+),score=50.42 GHVS01030637.1:32-1051(+)
MEGFLLTRYYLRRFSEAWLHFGHKQLLFVPTAMFLGSLHGAWVQDRKIHAGKWADFVVVTEYTTQSDSNTGMELAGSQSRFESGWNKLARAAQKFGGYEYTKLFKPVKWNRKDVREMPNNDYLVEEQGESVSKLLVVGNEVSEGDQTAEQYRGYGAESAEPTGSLRVLDYLFKKKKSEEVNGCYVIVYPPPPASSLDATSTTPPSAMEESTVGGGLLLSGMREQLEEPVGSSLGCMVGKKTIECIRNAVDIWTCQKTKGVCEEGGQKDKTPFVGENESNNYMEMRLWRYEADFRRFFHSTSQLVRRLFLNNGDVCDPSFPIRSTVYTTVIDDSNNRIID